MLIQLPNDAVSVGYKEVRPFHHEQVFQSVSAGFTGTEREFVQAGHGYAYQRLGAHARAVLSRPGVNYLLAANIPGVKSIKEDKGRMVVEFEDGVKATVVESPLSQVRRELVYDVFLPSSHGPMFAADLAPSMTPDDVVKLLTDLANKAATARSN